MALGTVALLFTDLVGSTELSNRIGPGPSEVLRREHFALLRDAVAATGGREVKNLGDGLMLAFPSATAAVDAAVLAQQAIEARNRRSDLRFEVRMGVAIGEVTDEDGDYFGEAVVQAARLCGLAHGGQVLVTDVVRMFAGSTAHTYASVGALELKGLPDSVAAHEVIWAPATDGGMPLPARLRGAPEVAYVGRGTERAALDAAWKAASVESRSSLVLLAGEPGIGKTRLASHHAFAAHEAGGTLLYGAVDDGLGVPYQPWIEAIGHYVDHAPVGLLEAHVADSGGDLVRLVPGLARRVAELPPLSTSDGETERYLLLEAVTRLLRAAAADNPVLVVLDDLQWADKPTLLLLAHLHRSLFDSRVMFVGTYRDSELTPEHALTDVLAALRREDRVQRFSLPGLGEDELVELIGHASGQEPTEDSYRLARMLDRDTNGNPLFVGEVLRDLLEEGHVALNDDGIWALSTSIEQFKAPDSVRDVVAQRVGRLGADATRVLATAAVIGREFEVDLLAGVLDEPPDALLDTVEGAMSASLLTEVGAKAGSLRFIHALIAQALVEGLSSLRRNQLHRHIASTIEQLYGPDLGDRIATVARHLLAAGDDELKTIDYSRRAGQHALLALAPDEALRWFEAALELFDDGGIDDDALRCDLLTDIGEAMWDAGLPGARDQLIDAAKLAQRLGDGDAVARAVLVLNRSVAASLGTTDEELIAAIEAALELRSERDGIRARLLAMLGAEVMLYESLERRQQLVAEAVDIAKDLDDVTLGRVLVSKLGALWTTSMLAERRQTVTELRRLLPGVSDPQVRAFTALHGVWSAIEAGDRPELARSLMDARAAGAATAQPAARWLLHVVESLVALVDGDLELSEQEADAGLALATDAGIQDGFLVYSTQLLARYQIAGRIGELADLIEERWRANPNVRAFRSVLATALAERGDVDDARVHLDAELAAGLDGVPPSNTWSTQIGSLVRAATRIGRTEAAGVLYVVASSVPDVMISTGATGSSHMSTELGMLAATLGQHDAAGAHFDHAEEHLLALGAPLMLARNRYEHARALLQLGQVSDGARARNLLQSAAAEYAASACPVRVAQCEELLAGLT